MRKATLSGPLHAAACLTRAVDTTPLVEHLGPELKEGDVVAIMSNGGFGGIHDKILDVLQTGQR